MMKEYKDIENASMDELIKYLDSQFTIFNEYGIESKYNVKAYDHVCYLCGDTVRYRHVKENSSFLLEQTNEIKTTHCACIEGDM